MSKLSLVPKREVFDLRDSTTDEEEIFDLREINSVITILKKSDGCHSDRIKSMQTVLDVCLKARFTHVVFTKSKMTDAMRSIADGMKKAHSHLVAHQRGRALSMY